MKRTRVTLVPIVIATAAFFIVLPRSGGDETVRMAGSNGSFSFEPAAIEAAEGARLLFVNDTEATHTVTASTGAFDLEIQPGDSRFLELDGAGTYDFYCRFHGASDGMAGTLQLGDVAAVPSASPSAAPTS